VAADPDQERRERDGRDAGWSDHGHGTHAWLASQWGRVGVPTQSPSSRHWTQAPSRQYGDDVVVQSVSQSPQWASSLVRSTQAASHTVCPLGHRHCPAWQD
jgi:hypothetical protein